MTLSFPLAPGAYVFRPLKRTDPMMRGFDVYALQTALEGLGFWVGPDGADGFLGNDTEAAIEAYQEAAGLLEDRIAGGATQGALSHALARRTRVHHQLPSGIPKGTLEHESSNLLGNHTAPYSDGSRDEGIAQRNTNFATTAEAFDASESVDVLGKQIAAYHGKYVRAFGTPDQRAWELACLSWNSPAWADALARGSTLTPESKAKADAYIEAVTKYAPWRS